jgi:integrase
MASIEKWKGGRWRAHWRTPDNRPQSKVFDRKIDAQNHITAMESSKLMGAYIDPKAGRITFREYAETWRAIQPHRPTTSAKYKRAFEIHIYPTIGDRSMSRITTSNVQALVSTWSQTLAPNTVKSLRTLVGAVFAAAVADRVIASSPCTKRVSTPKTRPAEIDPLPAAKVKALIDVAPERYRALIVVGAGCGLRFSEAAGLTVDRIDFLRRTMTIDRQLLPGAGPARWGPPKTGSSNRMIPMPQTVVDELARHLAAFPTDETGLVFRNERGAKVKANSFSWQWQRMIPKAELLEGTGYHALRHFAASLLIHHGASVKAVQRFLGHETPMTTLAIYSHLWEDTDDQTRAAIDGVLGSPVAQPLHDVSVIG